MFQRSILTALESWRQKDNRKPLVIRGARQVGKTTLVQQFATQFKQYIYLNLELTDDRRPFEQFTTIDNLLQALFFLKNKSYQEKENTLVFIDEIQEVPEALNILRYFFEQAPGVPVLAAGSLLETIFNQKVSFPVGRVDYLVVRPVSFPEFLNALGETSALEQLGNIPLPAFARDKLMQLFHIYALIGGMPEIVQHYATHKDITALAPIYESLITGYMDDVEKYATNDNQVQAVRHAIRASFAEAGKRIKFQGFGKSNYGSREMGEALRTLEKALLLYLIYPNTDTTLPLLPDTRKSPRLQVLDTGLVNYFVGIQREIIGTGDLNSVYGGTMIEHLAGQELLATQYNSLSSLHFWTREKPTSVAEVDYLHLWESKLIPIEVKSGKEGALKSLHLFMDSVPHNMAVRLYGGELQISEVETAAGKTYYLLNLPYCLASRVTNYLPWFQQQIEKRQRGKKS
jgi:predicted AAA+ superfamily ATPase